MSDASHHRPEDQPARRESAWVDFVMEELVSGESGAPGSPAGSSSPESPPTSGVPASGPVGSQSRGFEGSPEDVAALARAKGHVRALTALSRLSAPVALDGLVVASQHAGFQQDRAVQYVRSLTPHAAPKLLDDLVLERITDLPASHSPGAAPSVLDEMVEKAVSDPSAFVTEAMTSKLPDLEAPDGLAARLEQGHVNGLEEETRSGTPPHSEGSRASRRALIAGAASALALVGIAFLTISTLRGDGAAQVPGPSPEEANLKVEQAPESRLTIVRVQSGTLGRSDRAAVRALGGRLTGGNS